MKGAGSWPSHEIMQHLDHVTEEILALDQTIRPQRPQVGHTDLTLEERRRVNLRWGIYAVLIGLGLL